jgi:nucleoside-diphosphate-sugar epimerase
LLNYILEDSGWDLSFNVDSDFSGPTNEATAFSLYQASKILANNATWDFQKQKKPHFDLVTIHPTFVYGHDLLQTTPEEIGGTNSLLWKALTSEEPSLWPSYVNVRDVAAAHINALDSRITDGSSYILAAKQTTWKEVAQLLKKNYADIELFKLTDKAPENPLPIDGSKAEKELGIDYVSLETTIKDVVDQNVGLTKARA